MSLRARCRRSGWCQCRASSLPPSSSRPDPPHHHHRTLTARVEQPPSKAQLRNLSVPPFSPPHLVGVPLPGGPSRASLTGLDPAVALTGSPVSYTHLRAHETDSYLV